MTVTDDIYKQEDVNIQSTPPFIDHENGTRIYLPCLTINSDRFLHDLRHIYEAIMDEDNRFFIKAYNKEEPFRMELPNPFDIVGKKGRIRTTRKTCEQLVCSVKPTEKLTVREREWVRKDKEKEPTYQDNSLVIMKTKFLSEPVESPDNDGFL